MSDTETESESNNDKENRAPEDGETPTPIGSLTQDSQQHDPQPMDTEVSVEKGSIDSNNVVNYNDGELKTQVSAQVIFFN